MQGLLIVLLVLCSFVLTPILAIWALNTLFPVLAIPFVFKTWLAMLTALLLFKAQISAKFSR